MKIKFKRKIHEAYESILKLNKEEFKKYEKDIPKYHWTYNDEYNSLSIIYPVFGMYEAYNFKDEVKRFKTLKEAKEYLIN